MFFKIYVCVGGVPRRVVRDTYALRSAALHVLFEITEEPRGKFRNNMYSKTHDNNAINRRVRLFVDSIQQRFEPCMLLVIEFNPLLTECFCWMCFFFLLRLVYSSQ